MGCNIDGGSGNRLPKRVRRASLDYDDFAKQANTMESDSNPARAINVVRRVAMLCDFIEHPGIKSVYDGGQPVSMPPLPGTLGFDVPLCSTSPATPRYRTAQTHETLFSHRSAPEPPPY